MQNFNFEFVLQVLFSLIVSLLRYILLKIGKLRHGFFSYLFILLYLLSLCKMISVNDVGMDRFWNIIRLSRPKNNQKISKLNTTCNVWKDERKIYMFDILENLLWFCSKILGWTYCEISKMKMRLKSIVE